MLVVGNSNATKVAELTILELLTARSATIISTLFVFTFAISFFAESVVLERDARIQAEAQALAAEAKWQEDWDAHIVLQEQMDSKVSEAIVREREAEAAAAAEAARQAETTANISGNTVVPISAQEIDEFVSLIYCEAGGQPFHDQLGVAETVVQRALDDYYGGSIHHVIFAPGQFDPVKADGTIRNGENKIIHSEDVPESCKEAAKQALAGSKQVVGSELQFRGSNGQMVFF